MMTTFIEIFISLPESATGWIVTPRGCCQHPENCKLRELPNVVEVFTDAVLNSFEELTTKRTA